MKMMQTVKRRRTKFGQTALTFFVYVVLGLVLYSTSSIYSIIYAWTDRTVKAVLIVLCVLPFFANLLHTKEFQPRYVLYFLSLSLLLIVSLIVNDSSLFNVFFFFARFVSLFAFMLFCKNKGIDVFEKLFNLCVVVCVVYLFLYFLFDSGLFNFPSKVYWREFSYGTADNLMVYKPWYVGYYGLYFKTSTTAVFGYQMNLLCGPFSEPGLYQFLINYGFFYYLFIRNKKSIPILVILLLSIFLCGSTMGYFSFFSLIAFFLLKKRKPGSYVLFACSLFFFAFVSLFLLTYKKNNTVSYSSRLDDSVSMLVLFANNPFGCGFSQGQYSYNGLLTIVVSYGIFSLLLLVPLAFSGKAFNSRDSITVLAFAFYLLFSLVDEPIGFSNYIIVFIASGLLSIPEKTITRKRYDF